jgi:hypothetical protein
MFPAEAQTNSNFRSNENCRFFKVENEFYIECPGLLSLENVVIGGYQAELTDIRNFAEQPLGSEVRMTPVEVPIFELSFKEDGTPILIRSVYSNDGKFAVGSEVGLIGTWDDKIEKFVSSKDLDEKDAEIAKLKAELAKAKEPKKEKNGSTDKG